MATSFPANPTMINKKELRECFLGALFIAWALVLPSDLSVEQTRWV